MTDGTGYGHFRFGVPFSVRGSPGKDSCVLLTQPLLSEEIPEWSWVL